jgi:hypothetical protein
MFRLQESLVLWRGVPDGGLEGGAQGGLEEDGQKAKAQLSEDEEVC